MHFPQIHGGLSGKGSPSGRGAQPLRHACGVPPPLPRGGLGIAENFSSSPEAPLPGELSSEARLRGCTKESLTDMPMAPPLGELAGVSPTERARMLTANPRRCDSIALTKSLPIAAQRFFPAGLALSVTFGDTSPKGRGFGRPEGAKNPPWRSQLLGGFLIAEDESAGFSHFCLYYMRSSAYAILRKSQALAVSTKKDPLSEIAAPGGGLSFWVSQWTHLLLPLSLLLYAILRKSQALHRKFTVTLLLASPVSFCQSL